MAEVIGVVAAAFEFKKSIAELKDVCSSINQAPEPLTLLLKALERFDEILQAVAAQDTAISRSVAPLVVQTYRQACENAMNDMTLVCLELKDRIKQSQRHSSARSVKLVLKEGVLKTAIERFHQACYNLSRAEAYACSAADAINTGQQTVDHARPVSTSTQSFWTSKIWGVVPIPESTTAFMASNTRDHVETIKHDKALTVLSRERKGKHHGKGMHTRTSLLGRSRLVKRLREPLWEQATRGLTWSLRPYNIVPDNFPTFRLARENNLIALRELFQTGQASPDDSTNDGWTLVHTALYHSRPSVVEFLIREGVDLNQLMPSNQPMFEDLGTSSSKAPRIPSQSTGEGEDFSEPEWRNQIEERIMKRFLESGESPSANRVMLAGSIWKFLHTPRWRFSSSLLDYEEPEPTSLDQSSTPGMTEAMTEEITSIFESAVQQNFPEDFRPGIKGTDVVSMISDPEDIASQKATQNLALATVAEIHFAKLFAEKLDISSLCEELLAKIPRERFVQNFRRLLKPYYIRLTKIANSDLEKATIFVLQKRAARERISRHIAERLKPFTEEEQLRITEQDKGALDRAQRLEEWILSTPGIFRHPDEQIKAPEMDVVQDADPSELSNSDSEDGEYLQSDLPSLRSMEDFLTKGVAFEALLTDLQIFTLPSSLSSLTRVLMTILNENISFEQHYEPSLRDKWKEYMERTTGNPWNWWPLPPSKPHLATGDTRISWKCHCGAKSWKDVAQAVADRYQSLLRSRGNHLRTNHMCLNLRRRKISIKDYLSQYSSFLTRPQQNPLLHASEPSSNSQLATSSNSPQAAGAQNSSRTVKSSLPIGISGDQGALRNRLSGAIAQTINISSKLDSFVLLGVYGGRDGLEVAHIDTNHTENDDVFFQVLQKEYRSKRGWLKCWFSIWQLNHFDFVRFEKCCAQRVVSRGSSLPADFEYEYNPRPPGAEMPPITPHEFRMALSSCPPNCRFALLHSCSHYSDSDYAIQRIPKKKNEWCIKTSVKPGDADIFAWGLETYYVTSKCHVVFYNLLILLGPFAFWAWWQRKHPADMQNASIPTTFVLGLLALFWTLSGILEDLRHPVSFS